MIACGSRLRPPADLGPTPLVRIASDVGCDGVALEAGTLADVRRIGAEAVGAGLALAAIQAPLPEAALPARKRLPYLAAIGDRDERAAAVALARRTVEAGRDLGAACYPLELGRVSLVVREPLVRAHFARRELDPRSPGRAALDAALAERRKRSPALLDACRWSLERLIRVAEAHDARLVLLPAASPWEAPSPREALDLLRDFAGAPLGAAWSPARLARLGTLGLAVADATREALRGAAALVEATDAVGLEHPLAPGLGEVPLGPLPAEVPVVLSGGPDTTVRELSQARQRVLAAQVPAEPPAGGATPSAP